jgi:uncharacterized membrane protein YdfJ with MMPL/SSD domain
VAGPLYRLGRFAAGHGWWVVGIWVLAALAVTVVAAIAGKPTNNDLTLPGTDSTLLVPAVMILMGKANWWFPGFLERHMPRIGIEGEDFFDQLDAQKGDG